MASIVVIKLSWDSAIHESGIKLYNIYQDDLMIGQTDELKYNVTDAEKGAKLKYYVTALTYSGDYLKSNTIELITGVDEDGFETFDYTLDFIL